MKNIAAVMRPGVVSSTSRWRNATHGAFASDQPKKPSMYIDTGAILSLQKAFREEEVDGEAAAGGAAAATHRGAQS